MGTRSVESEDDWNYQGGEFMLLANMSNSEASDIHRMFNGDMCALPLLNVR